MCVCVCVHFKNNAFALRMDSRVFSNLYSYEKNKDLISLSHTHTHTHTHAHTYATRASALIAHIPPHYTQAYNSVVFTSSTSSRIQTFKCLSKLLHVSYLEHKTNDWVRNKINFLAGPQEPFLAIVKRRELAWFGHFTRHDSLSRANLQGTLESGRRRGQHRKF